MGLRTSLETLGLVTLLLVILSPGALAYLDPGTGAAVWQFLAASFLGALFAVKVFWKRITDFFRRTFRKGGASDDER